MRVWRAGRHAGRRRKTFTTALGEMTLERAWYHCDACGKGFAPRDRALGVDGTVAVAGGIAHDRARRRPRELRRKHRALLRELAGLDIDAKSVGAPRRGAGARAIADDERRVVEPEPNRARTLYLGLDGTGVPVRKCGNRTDRPGRQPDGSAKTREAKVAVVWSAETHRPHRHTGT